MVTPTYERLGWYLWHPHLIAIIRSAKRLLCCGYTRDSYARAEEIYPISSHGPPEGRQFARREYYIGEVALNLVLCPKGNIWKGSIDELELVLHIGANPQHSR